MSVFTIADLHLSTSAVTNKAMDVFGSRWHNYEQKIKTSWERVVTENDTVIIPGDISWATTIEEAESDFRFLEALPGNKIIGKGNHDFWWSTLSKINGFFEKNDIKSIKILQNNAFLCENFIIAGTRGWFYDTDNSKIPENSDYDKLIAREAARLRLSLDAARKIQKDNQDCKIIAFMHFPPVWNGVTVGAFTEVLDEYGVKQCCFGHIHSVYTVPESFEQDGIRYTLISSDYLNFVPKLIV